MAPKKSIILILIGIAIFLISIKFFGIVLTGKPIENTQSKLIISSEEGEGEEEQEVPGRGTKPKIIKYSQCNDKKDNDNDGLIDFPSDPGCTSYDDDNERDGELTASFNMDVKVNSETKNVRAGNKVLADVRIINLGDLNPVDVFLKCNLERPKGTVLTYYAEYITIDSQITLARELTVPTNASGGQYDFICFLTYNDQQIHASDKFTVFSLEEPGYIYTNMDLILLIFLIILLLIRVYSITIKKKTKKIKKRRKAKIKKRK